MSGVRVELVGPEWPRMGELEDQIYDLLCRDFGVAPDDPWRHSGDHGALAAAIDDDGRLLGTARLLPYDSAGGSSSRQIRHFAVVPDARQRGVGRMLMEALEEAAVREGASAVWLNSRDTAYGFYERLGYRFDGDEFINEMTGIPHRRMVKDLTK